MLGSPSDQSDDGNSLAGKEARSDQPGADSESNESDAENSSASQSSSEGSELEQFKPTLQDDEAFALQLLTSKR